MPPTWVKADETAREWAGIAHVRVVSILPEGKKVFVTVEGQPGDVAIFERIVKLNIARW